MTLFLCASARYSSAIKAFDPLSGDWLIRIIDPLPKSEDAEVHWLRIVLFSLLLGFPIYIFSAIASPTFGGQLFGKGGLLADFGVYTIWIFIAGSLALLVVGRRLLGELIEELVQLEVIGRSVHGFSPRGGAKGRILHFFEWITRIDGRRSAVWYAFCILDQVFTHYGTLSDGRPVWNTSNSATGSLMYALSVGHKQPNLSGLWFFLVFAPIGGYLLLPISRLIVAFACLCARIARSSELAITPTHPDGTGGLKPIGQVALFLSLFQFLVGINLAGVSANEFIVHKIFDQNDSAVSYTFGLLLVSWLLYLVVGTLLFMLPILPLRVRMAEAKRRYLISATQLQGVAEREHQRHIQEQAFRPDSLQGLTALDQLIKTADEMAVWPFDKATFARYAGLLISPLAPLVAERLPSAVGWLKSYLGL